MRKRFFGLIVVAAALLASALYGAPSLSAKDDDATVLKFDTMAGVSRPYTGAANAIRGIAGGGLPWVVAEASGELKQSGELKVKIRGLAFDPNDAAVIARGLAGTNTVASLKAIVSCQSATAGVATVVNVSTDLFPATLGLASAGGGNAEIEGKVDLPKPCIAPIIFVANPGGAWFTATGS